MAEFEKVAELDEIVAEGRKSIIVDDLPALLIRLGDDYYAIEDVCTHDGQPLTEGPIVDCQIVCPRHGAHFDLATGEPRCMPATEPIATYVVELRSDGVYVKSNE